MAQSRDEEPSGTGSLRLLLVASIIVPPLLGGIAGYLSYVWAYHQATVSASETVTVAAENTGKLLDAHWLVAARIADLLGTMRDEQIRAREKWLHDRLEQQIAGMPEIAAAWVIDANGHELVSARVYPVNQDLDQSGRDDFRALQDPNTRTFIWMLRARNLGDGEFEPYFTISVRRPALLGRFDGIIVVAVSGAYFASFYNSLLEAGHYSARLARGDGVVLARYPAASAAATPSLPDPLLVKAIAEEHTTGMVDNGSPFDGAGRIVAIKRMAHYPVYVTIERTKASILADWLHSIVGYVIIGVPATIALIMLSRALLRRARREQLALAQAGKAFAGRAALEVRLRRAQRYEAVGLLSTGLVADFSEAVAIARSNIERLAAAIGGSGSKPLVAAARESCGHAAGLAQRLLGLARHERLRPQPIDLNEVIVELLELTWPSGDHFIGEARLQPELWPVRADPDQVAAVLLDIAFDVQDTMIVDSRLSIETVNCSLRLGEIDEVPPGDYVSLSVETTGSEPGEGGEPSASLARAFAAQSEGYCTVEAAAADGARIRLYLPRYIADRAGPDTAEALRSAGDALGLSA